VFFGMLGVTFFGLLLTPVFYLVIRATTARINSRRKKPATVHTDELATHHSP